MAKYCLDTSALSNPFMDLPEDIYVTLWQQMEEELDAGIFCWNVEIAEELKGIYGHLGETLKACDSHCCLEVGTDDWPWETYLQNFEALRQKYAGYISEYNGNRKGTIGLNDLSIIALAKTLELPLVSMESTSYQTSDKKIRIPGVCQNEGIPHLDFNDFLRAEGIKV